ncbi:hypothetical protein IMG5_067000 [Ichthyophthirius multifiliis]|uniref:Transmembrane protein n=1 Tax=Ichthyophthirius multifiliis TaxID=5932 RepID=G0QPD5_ICHMU|nr:hypothetical protein IMG5_067000 [Ichthyophthirius multifiliis]EGR32903.1 hypothetical protein IMG5_067000 [Ichthyophthirius multifiliis]|eukprot:XP_004036889.1 hypothetical protein IMG5_067000 [Ichthyophthirius multifiliis]
MLQFLFSNQIISVFIISSQKIPSIFLQSFFIFDKPINIVTFQTLISFLLSTESIIQLSQIFLLEYKELSLIYISIRVRIKILKHILIIVQAQKRFNFLLRNQTIFVLIQIFKYLFSLALQQQFIYYQFIYSTAVQFLTTFQLQQRF